MTVFELYDAMSRALLVDPDAKCFFMDDGESLITEGGRWSIKRVITTKELATNLVELVVIGEHEEG